jgi:BASS family bile acid:Na+ symporter
MFLLGWGARVLVMVFLFTSMLSIGLRATPEDFAAVPSVGGRLARLLLVNLVAVPLVALALIRMLPPDPARDAALAILACAPGGISALQYTANRRFDLLTAGVGTMALALAALALAPVLLQAFLPGPGPVRLPHGRALLWFFALLCLPMALGLAAAWRWPRWAHRLHLPVGFLGIGALMLAGWLIAAPQKEAIHAIGIRGILVMALFSTLCLGLGWLAGGRIPAVRRTFALATSMRNVPLSLLLALHAAGSPAVQAYLVAFSLIMVVPGMVFYYLVLVTTLDRAALKGHAQALRSRLPGHRVPKP